MPGTERKPAANNVVSAAVHTTSVTEVEELALTRYGIRGSARRLGSERDENFLLEAEAGRRYVLKITNSAEDRAVTDFQTMALLHVERQDPDLPVPHLVRAADGSVRGLLVGDDGEVRVVRLLSFLPGRPVHDAQRSAMQCRNIGAMLARLDRALETFTHPAAGHELRWDLTRHKFAAADLAPV